MTSNAEPMVSFGGSIFLGSSNVAVSTNRLDWRAGVLIARNEHAFKNMRVLDLASHDGRFSHAALTCGASHVVGVEAREEHVQNARTNFRTIGHDPDRYEFVVGDLVAYLRSVEPHTFDTILCFGVLSHLIETVEVFREVRRIAPKYFILDTWLARRKLNFIERWRNYWVNEYVSTTQLGRPPASGSFWKIGKRVREVLTNPAYETGSLVFLFEDADAGGATIRRSGLMAWPTRSLVGMLFHHFDFDFDEIDWRSQGISAWTDLWDYRNGDRGSWVARPRSEDPIVMEDLRRHEAKPACLDGE